MSIDDATPEEWDEVHQKLKNLGISHEGLIRNKYGNDVNPHFRQTSEPYPKVLGFRQLDKQKVQIGSH